MKVLKTITTPTQRIPAGTELADDVVLDGPLSREEWQRLGHLEASAVGGVPEPTAPSAEIEDSAPAARRSRGT